MKRPLHICTKKSVVKADKGNLWKSLSQLYSSNFMTGSGLTFGHVEKSPSFNKQKQKEIVYTRSISVLISVKIPLDCCS